jgi:hypothetical protein
MDTNNTSVNCLPRDREYRQIEYWTVPKDSLDVGILVINAILFKKIVLNNFKFVDNKSPNFVTKLMSQILR